MAPHVTPRRTPTGVSAEKFVAVYRQAAMEGRTVKWVAEQLGMRESLVYSRANAYKKEGVKLPKLRRSNARGTKTAELNELEKRLSAGSPADRDSVVSRLLDMVRSALG
jgi:transposase